VDKGYGFLLLLDDLVCQHRKSRAIAAEAAEVVAEVVADAHCCC
jgi:hypothetical protein